ncbi:hypothetical protein [Azospirillum sp. ST 5-10]|uniref:hypothetical protein n=1 Tax=unclassified Azospirillum TaxID=2630922 RepID=UPI003F4A2EC2
MRPHPVAAAPGVLQRAAAVEVHMDATALARFKLSGNRGGTLDALTRATKIKLLRGTHAFSPSTVVRLAGPEFPVEAWATKDGTVVYYAGLLSVQRFHQYYSYLRQLGFEDKIEQYLDDDEAEEALPADMVSAALEPWADYLSKFPHVPVHLSIMPFSMIDAMGGHNGLQILSCERPFCIAYQATRDRSKQVLHLIVDIAWAHGEIAGLVVTALREEGIRPSAVNLHGICGSLTPAVGRDTMVVPSTQVVPASSGLAPVSLPHNQFSSAVPRGPDQPTVFHTGEHGHVYSLLEETPSTVGRLLDKGVHTLEMESYFLARAFAKHGMPGTFRMAFTVSDVVTSAHENMTVPAERSDASWRRRTARNQHVLNQFFPTL